jgi:uncharacterized integral membrane protein (TIGR00698 family)
LYRGVVLAIIIAFVSYWVAPYIYSMNSIIMGLFLGILVGNLIKLPESFDSGIGFTSNKLLELSIVFLAFSINYTHIREIGLSSFVVILILVLLVLLLTLVLSKLFKCPGSTGWLVGFGTAICGSSAIAALASTASKNKSDVGISMAVINLFGVIGMIGLPFILGMFSGTPVENGLILGGSLHSVGNVAGAAYAMGSETGEVAITVKLARVSLLSPALIFFNIVLNKGTVSNWKHYLRLPWYLIVFILITILTSLVEFPQSFLATMSLLGVLTLTTAMVAIGLKVSFRVLYESGKKGLLFGLVMFLIQIVLLVGLMFVFR